MSRSKSNDTLTDEIGRLQHRLAEADAVLKAIRNGEVDALVVSGSNGDNVYTLKGAHHPYRVLVETMNEGALTLTPDGSILYTNTRFGDMMQQPIQRIIGRNMQDFVAHEEKQRLLEILKRAVDKAHREEILFHNGEKSIPVMASLTPLVLDDIRAVCMVVMDLTRQKEFEEKQRIQLDLLESKNKELQEFTYAASHDLQEPLRKIRSFGDLLQNRCRGIIDETSMDYLQRMQNASKRMSRLIEELLGYSRVTTGGRAFSPVDLNKIAQEALLNLEFSVSETSAEVEIEPLPMIQGDPFQMIELFQNLMGNAIKFHRPQLPPRIRIYSLIRKRKNQLRLYFEDNGIGVEEKYLDRIFLPFERLHGRTHYEGVGMGLTICRKIVERHKGNIATESKPGEGTTFIVTLPIQQEQTAGK